LSAGLVVGEAPGDTPGLADEGVAAVLTGSPSHNLRHDRDYVREVGRFPKLSLGVGRDGY
jgi:hypothetical protein